MSSAKRKACPIRSSQDGDESDNGGADWRKYLKLEADDEVADRAEADSAAVSRRGDVTGRWTASSTAGVAEECRSADATGKSDERRRSDVDMVPSSRSLSSPSLSRDSKATPSGTVWTSSATGDSTEQQKNLNTWLVFVRNCSDSNSSGRSNCSRYPHASVSRILYIYHNYCRTQP